MQGITHSLRIILGCLLFLPVMGQFTAADSFDLDAVTDLVTRSRNAEQLERSLNKAGNKYNNLDLDLNSVIDFINVNEVNNHAGRGLSLSVEVTPNEIQELAFIQLEQLPNSRSIYIETIGNSQIYGQNYFCHCSLIFSSVTIWPYLSGEHESYQSPYNSTNHPNYFLQRKPKSAQKYINYHLTQPYKQTIHPRGITTIRSVVVSPFFGRNARTVRAPLFKKNRRQVAQVPFSNQGFGTRTQSIFRPFAPRVTKTPVAKTPFSQSTQGRAERQKRSIRPPVIRPRSHPNSQSRQ